MVKPGRYRHYKGSEYEVIGCAKHSETEEEFVVYRALYGERGLWVRPASIFVQHVMVEGTRVPRFTLNGGKDIMSLDWRRGTKRFLLALILSPIVLAAFYLLIVFHWSFSDGDRVGYLQKFSRKGWICKTYEGELAMTTVPGLAPVIWDFSVWDNAVASKIDTLLGKKVVLHYREYRGIPTECFGATDYFVDRIEPAE